MSHQRKQSSALRKHEFKEDHYDNPTQLLNQRQLLKPKNQIELLEVYVEQAQSMTIGQRLVWHINQQERLLTLPNLPQSDEYKMKVINAKFQDPLKVLNEMSDQYESKHKEYTDIEKMIESNIGQYSKESNTVFYYDKYKVLILIDFSKSTSNIYASQSKSYLDKNLLFRLENKYSKKNNNLHTTQETKYRTRKSSHQDDLIIPQTRISVIPDQKINENLQEELSDQSPIGSPRKKKLESSTFYQKRQNIDGDDLPQLNSDDKINIKVQKTQKKIDPKYYEPKIFLSIAASGLPQMNQMRLLVHNQKIDDFSINEVLNSLESKLQMIEDHLADNYNNENEKQTEYLQRHLYNGANILNFMCPDAKPLLILLTDSTNSLLGRQQNGKMDPLISKLHQSDTKIITVDLGQENKIGNSFGFVNNAEHLKYLAYVTRGVYFDYNQITKLANIFNPGFMESMRPRLMSTSQFSRSGKKDSKFSRMNIKKQKFSQELSWALGGYTKQLQDITSSPQQMINYSLFNQKVGILPDLSEQDRDHPYLNSLQKVMYSRPCSYSKFLQTSEIQELVNYEESLIFENRISGDLVRKLRKDRELFINTSFSAKDLLLNNMFVPIFKKEKLQEYIVKCSNLTAICHSRSKMCFQFTKITNKFHDAQGNSIKTSRKPSNSSQNESGGTNNNNQYGPRSKKVHYHHWWSNQILILCSLHQTESRVIHVKYKIVAQDDVIHQLRVENGQRKPSNQASLHFIDQQNNNQKNNQENDIQYQITLLEQLNNFIKYLFKMDKQHSLFEQLISQVDKGYDHIIKRQAQLPDKYKQDDFDQVYKQILQQQQNISEERKLELDDLNNTNNINIAMTKQQSMMVTDINNSNKQQQQQQDNLDKFNQYKPRPRYHQNSDKPFQTRQVKDEVRDSSQRSLQSRKTLQKKRSARFDTQHLPKQTDIQDKLTDIQFTEVLKKNKKSWQKLSQIPLSQWPQLFYYTKLDLLTHSNFKFDEIIYLCSQMDNKYNPDFQISKIVHEIMVKLTTFTIEDGLYIQFFREKQSYFNESKFKRKSSISSNNKFTSSGNRSKSRTQQINNDNSGGSGNDNIKTVKDDYGFCLIKVEWAAANVAVFHFGFYEVNYKVISTFLDNFIIAKVNYSISQDTLLQDNHEEKVKKLVFDNLDKKCQYFNVNDYQFFDKNISQLLIPDDKKSICYHKNWVWKNENRNTNKDFFEVIMKQRIKEGFYFVNRGCYTDKYLFIKTLPAYKVKLSKKNQSKQNSYMREYEDNSGSNSLDQKPDTYVLIQYVMYFDRDYEAQNKGQSCFKTEIYMEQESAYFYFQKNQQLNFQAFLQSNSSTTSFLLNPTTPYNQNVIGEFKQSVISGFNNNNRNGDSTGKSNNNKNDYSCLSDKNFFYELYEYLQSVDSFLFNNICTYHNIVKNSVLKLINSPEPQLIKGEVCYFRNLSFQKVKQRKRLKLELAIRHKMQLLKRDWREYLKNEYPELFTNQIDENENFDINNENDNKNQQINHIDKINYSQPNSSGLKNRKNSQFIQSERIMEEASFVVQIEELLENSKLIKIQQFDVPQIIFSRKCENLKETLNKFYDQLIKVIDEFCDFKIQNFSNEKLSEKYNFYAKLVTKQILFLIKMPSKQEFIHSILSNKNTGRMSIEFFRLSKKMIKISTKLMKNKMLFFLNQNFIKEQSQNESVNSKQIKSVYKTHSDHNSKQKQQEKSNNNQDETPIVVPMFEQEDSEDDENINQIDQLFDFIFYYETSIRNSNNNLAFEPNVRTIINNFCEYLQTNYEIIFADTVLMSLSDEMEKQQITNGVSENKKNPLQSFEEDFERIKPTMTQCRFRMDISFLILLIQTLRKQGLIPDNDKESNKRFINALDDIFHNLIRRNFQQFEIDPEYFIFKHNQLDKALVRELSTPIKGEKRQPMNFSSVQEDTIVTDSTNYQVDLLGTKDSYSDSEDSTENIRKPKDNQQILGAQEIYNSCKRLLFKVNLVIRNSRGEKVIDEQLEKISQICDKYGKQIEETCQDLVEKVKFMEEEKMIADKNNDAILRGLRMMYEMRDQQQMNLDSYNSNQVEAQDIQSSVELYFSFYTIPQYVGLIRDQDIDFLCIEKDEILVNDDDHEDLIRVAKLMDYLGYGYNSERRTANEDIQFQELYKAFNKKQLVKSIPYYFKRLIEGTDKMIEKDYNVYFYDEIQRKIIYGILRRTYALVAQNLLENAALIRPIDSLNVTLVQKYIGSLLFNQRQLFRVVVINKLGNKQKQALQILKEDLKQSQILNCLCVNHKNEEMYLIRSTEQLINYYLKHQLEDGNLIPFLQHLSEDRTSMLSNEQNNGLSPYFRQKQTLMSSQQFCHKQFDVPFWLLFQIQESEDNGGEIRLNVVYHLPLYKAHSQLNSQIVQKELNRALQLIGRRIKVILLLQQVSELRYIPNNLQLNERIRKDTAMSGIVGKQIDFKSYQMIQSQQTLNRMENAKNMMNDMSKNDPSQSPIVSKQPQQNLKQMTEKPTTTTTTSKTAGITSKFRHRMEKLQKQKQGNITDDNQSDSQIPIDNQLVQTTQEIQKEEPVQIPQQQLIQDVYKVNVMYEYAFNIKHSSVKLDEALSQIALQARMYHPVQGCMNLYVTSINSNIYLMKLSAKSNCEIQNRKMGQGLSSLRSFTNANSTFDFPNSTMLYEAQTPHQSTKDKQRAIDSSQINQQQSFKAGFQNQSCNQIIMELFGAYSLKHDKVEPLIQTIENILKKFTINVIAFNTQFTAGLLSKDDYNYLEEADKKLVLLFPIAEQIQDKYAMLRFLKQNMSRYLYQVTFKSDFLNQSSFNNQSIVNDKVLVNSTLHQSHSNLYISKQDSMSNQQNQIANTLPSEISRLQRQSSVSSGDDTILSFRNDPASLMQKQRSNQMSKSQNIDMYSMGNSEELIRIENGGDQSDSQSSDSNNKEPKILYKQEDFLLLYNYKMSLNKQSKNQQIQKDKIREQNMQQVFNEALALINFGILTQFDDDTLRTKGSNIDLTQQNISLDNLQQDLQYEFDAFETQSEGGNENKQQVIFGMNYTCSQSKTVSNVQCKNQIPLIYKTYKDTNYHSSISDHMTQQQKLVLANNEYGVPVPNLQKNKWLMIRLNVVGELSEERFIQNLILNVNQTFNEVLIENQIRKYFKPIPQFNLPEVLTEKQSVFSNDEIIIEKPKQEKKKTDKSIISQQLEQLQHLISVGRNTFTMIVHEFEKLIYGDSNDLFLSLIFSMITHYHQELRSLNIKQKLLENYLQEEYGIIIIIELENKSSKKIDKTIVLNLSINLQPQSYELIYKELKFYLSRTQTVLRNIHPKLQLVIGSIDFNKDILSKEEQNNKIIVKYYKDPVLQLDGLRPEPEKAIDNQIPIKGYQDILTNVQTNLSNKEEIKAIYKRNFLIILSMYDSKVNYQSFNLDKKTLKLNINIIQNHLQWHSNRQDYFKKIVSQKLGTVYTLKEFYSSNYFIKDQNLKTILNSDKFTYEERAKIIEGKQVYQFQRPTSKSRRRRLRGNRNVEKVESSQKEVQNIADEYLKFIENTSDALRSLYKTISCRTVNQDKREVINERMVRQTDIRRQGIINPRANLHRAGQKLPEKIYQEDEREIKEEQIKRKINTRPIIQFKEFIKNKSIMEKIVKNNQKIELHLTSLFTISPGLSPCRIDYVLCEKEKLRSKFRQKTTNQLSRSSLKDITCQTNLNDKILLNNPLYYHGTKVYRMMAGFYNKMQFGKKASIVYKQSEAQKVQTERQTVSNKLLMFQDQLKTFIQLINQSKNRIIDIVPLIKKVKSQSRLLFSNTTMLLFDSQNYQPQMLHSGIDDFEISFTNLNDEKPKNKRLKPKNLHSQSEILVEQQPLISKAFMDEIKNSFFDNYMQFLVQKANVVMTYNGKPESTNPQQTYRTKSKRNITYQNIKQEFGSTNSMRKQVFQEDQTRQRKQIGRSKKISDDYSSIENFVNDKILEENSNLSLMGSSQFKDFSHFNFYNKKNLDRVLYQYQFQDHSDKNNLHSFIVKVRDDAIFIYELTFQNGLIRINVFGLYELLNLFPMQVLLNHSMLNSKYLGQQRKREIAKEELRLSTKLNTDSFNYDFHSTTIMNMILFPEKKMKDINPTQQISNLISFYKYPPKYARNYIDTVILRIDLGYLNKLSDLEFLSYFSQKADQYGLKIFNLKQVINQQLQNMNPLAKLSNLHSKRITSEITYDASKLIFYKYQQSAQSLSKSMIYTQQVNSNIKSSKDSKFNIRDSTIKSKGNLRRNDHSEEDKEDDFLRSSKTTKNLLTNSQIMQNSLSPMQQQQLITKQHKQQLKQQKSKEQYLKQQQQTTQQVQDQALTLKQQKTLKNQQRLQYQEQDKQQNYKKLFLVEMINKQGQHSNNTSAYPQYSNSQTQQQSYGQNDTFKKVWNLECKKQELSVSQINMDSYDEDDYDDHRTNNMNSTQNIKRGEQKTILELAFYYICVEDVNNQSLINNDGDIKIKKNTDRYPIKELSIDMYTFISQLENAFNECRKDLIKDQLWIKFFDPTKDLQLTDIQIGDMLRFSYQFDLKHVDDRYKEILQIKTYTQSFCDFLKGMFPNQYFKYNKNLQFKSGLNKRENLLIYDQNQQHFLIHLDFNYEEREAQAYLVRKENTISKSNQNNYFGGTPSSIDTDYSPGASVLQQMMDQSIVGNQSIKSMKQYNQIVLDQDEKQLVKKLMNLFAYWLYKTSV